MSLPDYLLEDDGALCECGALLSNKDGGVCWECRADLADLYADEAISERGAR